MNQTTIEKILRSPRLPTLPAVAMQVLEMTRDSQLDLHELADLVSNDQALAAKILKVVNSSFYALSSPCTTIHQAFAYLGLNTIKTLVLGFGLVDSVKPTKKKDNAFDYVAYWTRTLYTAIAAREIARCAGSDPEEAFLSGLIQDVGMVAILRVFDDCYPEMVRSIDRDHDQLIKAERQELHLDHAQIGGEIAEHWKMPAHFIQSIRYHHDSSKAEKKWCNFVRVGELAGYAADVLLLEEPASTQKRFVSHAGEWFDLNQSQCENLLNSMTEMVAELSKLFQLEIEDPPEAVELMDQAEEQLVKHHISLQEEHDTLKMANKDLAKQTLTDPLTGVANRKYFDRALPLHFQSALVDKGNLGLIFIDLDRFKSINDQHGHQVGDIVLADVAKLMTVTLGDRSEVCRYGGEEFAAFLPGSSRIRTAKVAEALRREIANLEIKLEAIPNAPPRIRVTASMGVASLEPDVITQISQADMLVRLADQAVYAAKAAGRNCVRVFNPSVQVKSAA